MSDYQASFHSSLLSLSRKSPRLVVGCMTGSSLDGLDAALVEIEGHGLEMTGRFVRGVSLSLGSLGPDLALLASGGAITAAAIAELAREFSLLHGRAVELLLEGARADLIAVHGQTVYHKPPVSWQLFNPAPLVKATGSPVVFDLRAADLAAGGEGAPITPIADFILFKEENESRAIVNLGGFINVTRLPAGESVPGTGKERFVEWLGQVNGGDVCACNQLLDGIARCRLGIPFDSDGEAASSGRVIEGEFDELVGILRRQAEAGRSLGSGDELVGWVQRPSRGIEAADLARTACAAIAEVLVSYPLVSEGRILLAGGGTRNRALRREIERRFRGIVTDTSEYGLPIEFREAAEMAVIGALAADGVPTTLPRVTHATHATVGGVWCVSV